MAAHAKVSPRGWGRRARIRLAILFAVPLIFGSVGSAAWAYWTAGSTAGSNGASAATSVNAGATPSGSPSGTSVTVTWAASTLATGQAATGYDIKRYDAGTLALQTISSNCSGTISGTSCTENAVPYGDWKYSVTPRFATNWTGAESAKSATVTVVNPDVTGPTGGSVGATGLVGTGPQYAASLTLSIVLNKGTDPSGVSATGALLKRATATLTSAGTANGTCGTFGTYSLISGGTDPASPKSDTVTDQACYRYQYTVQDTVGNATTYTSGDIKVDRTAPATPTLAFSSFTNTYWSGSGTTVYYRSNATPGSFVATATSSDTASGIASYTFPSLGTNWTSTPGALGVNTYSWSGAPAVAGTVNVTATNNATVVSANSPFTMTSDITAPSAGSVSYVNGSTGASTTASVTFTTGTDTGGSGIGTRLLQRASAPITGITCGTYSSFATVTGGTNPTSPLADTITAGNCYKYQYVVSDNVGNLRTDTSASVAHTPFGAYWALNAGSGTTAVDTFGNSNTGTLQAAAGWTGGKIGSGSVNLTGAATSYVDVPQPVIDTSQSYTVAAWVKLDDVTGYRTFLSIDGSVASPFYLQLDGGPHTFKMVQTIGDVANPGSVSVTAVAPVAGVWYHVAGVYDKTANTIQLYVNGVSQGTTTATTAWTATGHTAIGRSQYNGVKTDFVDGAIDEARMYDRALSANEVALLASYTGVISTTPNLVNYWHLGEASGTTARDSEQTTPNNGTYNGSPTLGATGRITNDSDTAVTFDGVNDYVIAPRQISGDFSIEFWFKSTQVYSNDLGQPHCTYWWQGAGLVDAETFNSVNDFGVELCDGKVVAGTGNPDISIVSASGYNNGAWHYVVFNRTQSTGALQLFIDGTSVGTATGNTNALTATANINIGRAASGTNYFAGTIDEVALYSGILSGATIANHYAAAQ